MDWMEELECEPSPRRRVSTAKIVKDNKIVIVDHCKRCGSMNIKKSKRGYYYCADICWKKKEPTNT